MTTHDGMIPEDQRYVKLGGGHGQGAMKFAYQLANLDKPNSSKKTVVFSIFEAKDTRNNMRTALGRYKEQLEALKQTTLQRDIFSSTLKLQVHKIENNVILSCKLICFVTTRRNKSVLLFLFGDYEFLCKIVGISGGSGEEYNSITQLHPGFNFYQNKTKMITVHCFLS